MQRKIPWKRLDAQKKFRLSDRDFYNSERLLPEQLASFDADSDNAKLLATHGSAVRQALLDARVKVRKIPASERIVETGVRLLVLEVRRFCEAGEEEKGSAATIRASLIAIERALSKACEVVDALDSATRRYLSSTHYRQYAGGARGHRATFAFYWDDFMQRLESDPRELLEDVRDMLLEFEEQRDRLKQIDPRVVQLYRAAAIVWYRTTRKWPSPSKDSFARRSEDTSAPLSPLYELLVEMVRSIDPDKALMLATKTRKTFIDTVVEVRDEAKQRFKDQSKLVAGRAPPNVRLLYYQDLRVQPSSD